MPPVSAKKPIVLSAAFDGSRDLKMWADTMSYARAFAARHGQPLHFTYFINTCYYDPNVKGSKIGRALSADEARLRWAMTQQAINEGHEIGNHTVRHADGSKWTKAQWKTEIDEFDAAVRTHLFAPVRDEHGAQVFPRWREVEKRDGECPKTAAPQGEACVEPEFPVVYHGEVLFDAEGKPNLSSSLLRPYRVVGFRAPELAHNAAMYEVLSENGYIYDTSQVLPPTEARLAHDGGKDFSLYEFPLMRRSGAATIPMDYNYLLSNASGERMASDYKRAVVEAQAQGVPWNIGHHFSLWKDGAYWQAMKDTLEYAGAGCPDEAGQAQCSVETLSFGELAVKLSGGEG